MKRQRLKERLLALSFLVLGFGVYGADGPPVILTQPASQTVLQSYPALFNVEVDGTPPFLFQWLRNGAPIPTATNSAYTLQATAAGDQGALFSVLVTNSLGDATSGNAVLQIDPGTLGSNTVPVMVLTNEWRYLGAGTNLGTLWRGRAYDDSTWASGPALLWIGTNALPGPQNTLLPGTPGALPTAYYFRSHFTLTNPISGAGIVSIRLLGTTVIDDGAVFYLNGSECFRVGLGGGIIGYPTLANRTVTNAAVEGPFAFATSNLVNGDNLLAVEVHQASATNDDIAMGLALDLSVTVRGPDVIAPVILDQIPAAGATVNQ